MTDETPSSALWGSANPRLPGAPRLLVLETPSTARESFVALAKVLGVEDITVVECMSDAYAALENAGFDALIYDCDEQTAAIDGLIGQVRSGGLSAANTALTVIGKTAAGGDAQDRDAASPDVVLAKPLRFDRVFSALSRACSPERPTASAAA